MRSFTLLLALPLLGACRTGTAGADDATPPWHAEAIVTIGSDSGEASFASVRSLLFAKNGELLVVDHRGKEVKVFDATGEFLRRIGRSGAGPGEYADPYSIAWLGDTLALLDPGNSRIGLFGPDGKWAGQLPVQPISGGSDVRLYRTPGPSFWAYGYRVVDQAAQSLFIRYTAAGPQDSLPYIRVPSTARTAITCEFPDRSLRFFAAPFAPELLEIPTPDGRRALARSDAYRITFVGPAGDTVGSIVRDEPLRPIADSAWEAGLVEWREAREKTPGAKCDGEGFDRPAGRPVLGALFYDDQGRLWVEVHTVAGIRLDLYDAAGTRVATITGLPASGEVDPAIQGDRIAIALPDDGEAPRVAIFKVVTERSAP
jgi:hypothetical protein